MPTRSNQEVKGDSASSTHLDDQEKVVGSDAGGMLEYAAVPQAPPPNYEPTSEEDKKLDRSINWKTDLCVTLFLGFGFMFAGIDKTSIGNAATTSFIKDANLPADAIGDATSLFAVTFVPLQPFSIMVGKYVGPKYWMSFLMLSWGAVTMGHAAINSVASLYVLRLLLGALEAGYYPTAMFYISTMFPRYSLATRVGAVSSLFVLGSAFAGLIAYGVFHLPEGKYKGWQLLFLIEGGVTIGLGLALLFILPARIGNAWYLTPEERSHASKRMIMDRGFDPSDTALLRANSRKTSWTDVKEVLTDWPKLVIIMFNLITTLPVSAFGIFLPLITQGMGYSGIRANLMAVPPFVFGALGLVLAVLISDRFRERSLVATTALTITLTGLIVMVASDNAKLRYGFTNVCLSACFVSSPLGLAWLISNTPEEGKRAVLIGINGWANVSSVIAGQIFKAKYKPKYHFPLSITMGLMAIPTAGYPIMRGYFMWANRRRARALSTMSPEQVKEERTSTTRTGDKNLTFQYGY